MNLLSRHIIALDKMDAENRPLTFDDFSYSVGPETLRTLARHGFIKASFAITDKGKRAISQDLTKFHEPTVKRRKRKVRMKLAEISRDWMEKHGGKVAA